MKILILGNTGMLGHLAYRYFSKKYETIGLNREIVDFRHFNLLIKKINEINPNIIINCAGILYDGKKIDDFADINIVLPRILSKSKYKLIQISTNCVYKNIGPHDENDIPNATDFYGMSKAFGEIKDNKNLTIRCSITGPEIKRKMGYSGLMDQFIRNSSFTSGYINVFWNGITTLELVKFIDYAIKKDMTGLHNFYTYEIISKYELIKILNKVFNLNRKIVPIINEKAHQSLLTGKFYTKKSYEDQFSELKRWMRDNIDLYKNIYDEKIFR